MEEMELDNIHKNKTDVPIENIRDKHNCCGGKCLKKCLKVEISLTVMLFLYLAFGIYIVIQQKTIDRDPSLEDQNVEKMECYLLDKNITKIKYDGYQRVKCNSSEDCNFYSIIYYVRVNYKHNLYNKEIYSYSYDYNSIKNKYKVDKREIQQTYPCWFIDNDGNLPYGSWNYKHNYTPFGIVIIVSTPFLAIVLLALYVNRL